MWIKGNRVWLGTNGAHGERDNNGYIVEPIVTVFKNRNPDKTPSLNGILFSGDFYDAIVTDGKYLLLPIWHQIVQIESDKQRLAFDSKVIMRVEIHPDFVSEYKGLSVDGGLVDVVKFDNDLITIVKDGGETVLPIPVKLKYME